MGQKVNPHGLRVGIVKDWDAKWYADKDFAANLHEDVKIRNFLKKPFSLLVFPALKSSVQINVLN